MNQKQAHSGASPKDGASSSGEQIELGHCLVTGAAGFLGSHLVQGLLTAGYRVRALIRNTPLEMTHANLEIVSGSVEDAERMQEVCEGIDTVFHTAARLALLGGRAATESYRREAYSSNVEGTMNIIRACQRAGARRLVYTSSIDVCFDGVEDVAMNENTPYATFMSSVYTETKIAANLLNNSANLFVDVSVEVHEGRVLLTGAVEKPADRIEAVKIAWQADGVSEVINEIQARDDSDLLDAARDRWITTKLGTLITFDKQIKGVNYSIETVNGKVYLIGIAQSQAELTRVVNHARSIEYVRRVITHVRLKESRQSGQGA